MTDMSIHNTMPAPFDGASWAEFLTWARASGETYATIREIEKIPGRLGMIDEDAGLIAADLGHFERAIAPTSFAPVSKSDDMKAARARSNSRVRAALKRFLEARDPSRVQRAREDWDALIAYVEVNSSTPNRGGIFNVSAQRPLWTLRARSPIAPGDLTQDIVDRICREASSGKRDLICAGIRFLNALVERRDRHPAIADLSSLTLALPVGSSRARPIAWGSVSESFRVSYDVAFRRAIANPEALVAEMRARAAAGEDPPKLHAELEAEAACRGEGPGNEAVAVAGYRAAIT